jgi:spermidine synthase
LLLLSLACLAGAISLWGAEALQAASLRLLPAQAAGMPAARAAEAILAMVAFFPPTLLMGALFSHLTTRARAEGVGFERALAANTLGAAAAPVVFGLLVLPAFGAKAALLSVSAGYLLLARPLYRQRIRQRPGQRDGQLDRQLNRPQRMLWPAAIGAALAVVGCVAPPLAFVSMPEGARLLSYREGAMAAVSVVEEADGTRRLRIDNRQQEGSNAAWSADARQALLPLLLHPAPRTALFLGLGTGVTANSATLDPALRVEAVELLPEVAAAASWFAAPQQPANERLQVITADARRFVAASTGHYDLIVSDNFHPARSGSAALYTVEHFHAVGARLTSGGVFCQWLPLHQLDLPTLRSIVRAFATAFPQGGALLATHSLDTPVLGLIAHADGRPFDLAQVRQRVAAARRWPMDPSTLGLVDEYAVLGALVAGPQALQALAGHAPANTDDHPVVAYLAPRATYDPAGPPRERLSALMALLSVSAPGLVDADPADSARLAAYWSARTAFMAAGARVEPSHDVRRMLAQVEQPLLQVLQTSPDFRPAYDPLLQMAAALARSDADAARPLLAALARIQPARPEAAEALRRLEGRRR